MKKKTTRALRCAVVRGKVLGVNVYRGYAKVADLAEISQADIYDQQRNPTGTQRDLSSKHAREAYEYVRSKELGFWPEVFLCVRRNNIITYHPISPETPELGFLDFNVTAARRRPIAISRVDGNHRLQYGAGDKAGYSRVDRLISFCVAYDLSREEEIQLFKDINKNQKPMNTSHLDGIEVRLTKTDELKRRNPELYIAQRLHKDSVSPLHNRIYEGGVKPVGVDIPLRGLKTGIEYMLSRSTQLPRLTDAEAQYRVIKNYFIAVREWQPTAWETPKDYLLLRGSGLWAVCFIGAQVIDRALMNDHFDSAYMLEILQSGKQWDWGKRGDFVGLGGRAGALEISKRVTRRLQDESQMSTSELLDRIMSKSK